MHPCSPYMQLVALHTANPCLFQISHFQLLLGDLYFYHEYLAVHEDLAVLVVTIIICIIYRFIHIYILLSMCVYIYKISMIIWLGSYLPFHFKKMLHLSLFFSFLLSHSVSVTVHMPFQNL